MLQPRQTLVITMYAKNQDEETRPDFSFFASLNLFLL